MGGCAIEFRIDPGVTLGAFEIGRGVGRREQKKLCAASGARNVIGTKPFKATPLNRIVARVRHVCLLSCCVCHACIIPQGSDKQIVFFETELTTQLPPTGVSARWWPWLGDSEGKGRGVPDYSIQLYSYMRI